MNLTLIGPVESEVKMFKACGRWTTTNDGRQGLPILKAHQMSLRLRLAEKGDVVLNSCRRDPLDAALFLYHNGIDILSKKQHEYLFTFLFPQ